MAGTILVLSGPVGAGKTAIARELVKLLPAPVASIEVDLFWKFIAKSESRGPSYESFRMIMASMTAAAVPYAAAGSTVVLDFSMPPWFLEVALRIAGVRKVPIDYVVVRPSLAVCARR